MPDTAKERAERAELGKLNKARIARGEAPLMMPATASERRCTIEMNRRRDVHVRAEMAIEAAVDQVMEQDAREWDAKRKAEDDKKLKAYPRPDKEPAHWWAQNGEESWP